MTTSLYLQYMDATSGSICGICLKEPGHADGKGCWNRTAKPVSMTSILKTGRATKVNEKAKYDAIN